MFQFSLYVLALLISSLISSAVALYAFRRQTSAGSRELILLVIATAEWAFTAALEGISTQLQVKIFLTVLSYIGSQTTAVWFFLLVMRYTGQDEGWSLRRKAALLIFPAISFLLALTNSWHHLVWPQLTLVNTDWMGVALLFGHGPWFWIEGIYNYALMALSVVFLVRAILRYPHLFSIHSRVLVFVAAFPSLFTMLYAFGSGAPRVVDLTPVAFCLTGAVVAWLMFHWGFLELVPISREQIIESLWEGILLVDAKQRLIDANLAFRKIFHLTLEARGQPIKTVLDSWPEVLTLIQQRKSVNVELALAADNNGWYELNLRPLLDSNENHLGTLLAIRDISQRKQAEHALRESEQRYRLLIENQAEGIGIVDAQERFTFANLAADQIMGTPPGELVGRILDEFLKPDESQLVRQQTQRRQAGEKSTYELKIERPDGAQRIIEITASPQFTSEGQYLASFGIFRDITERRAAEDALHARERYLSLLSDITRAALEASDLQAMVQTLADQMGALLNADGCFITLWDDGQKRTIPTAAYGLMRATYPAAQSEPGQRTMTQSVLEAGHALVAEDVFNTPYMSAQIATKYPTRSMLALPLMAGGRKLGAVLIAFNAPHHFTTNEVTLGEQAAAQISLALLKNYLLQEAHLAREMAEAANRQLQQALNELDALATTDHLTGAYNRNKFDDLIHYEIEQLGRYCQPLSLLMFDIDHFKTVNDTYGHHIGDQVLIDLVQIVKANIRATDTLTRWGGEEFFILSPGIDLQQAATMAAKIHRVVSGHTFPCVSQLTISMGVTEANPGDTLDTLLSRVDQALYLAKNNGRNRVEVLSGTTGPKL